jgi:hypothetical protein
MGLEEQATDATIDCIGRLYDRLLRPLQTIVAHVRRQKAGPRYPAASITIGRENACDVLSAAVAALMAAGCPP